MNWARINVQRFSTKKRGTAPDKKRDGIVIVLVVPNTLINNGFESERGRDIIRQLKKTGAIHRLSYIQFDHRIVGILY